MQLYDCYMERRREYVLTELSIMNESPETLISGILDDEILSRMKSIVECESPIRESLLFKRTINSFSLQKVGSRILDKFVEIASKLEYEKIYEGDEAVYLSKPCDYFRPTPESLVRYSYQIPYVEGACAILHILENSDKASFTQKDLLRCFEEEMGYQKVGSKVLDLFKESLKDPRIKKSKNGRITK